MTKKLISYDDVPAAGLRLPPAVRSEVVQVSSVGGVVGLDSFAGASDDAKLTAAMSYAAAQTHIPAIQFPARDVTLITGGRTPYSGMKWIGPNGSAGTKNMELANSSYVNHRVIANVGSGTSALINGTATVYDIYIGDIGFHDSNGNSEFWHQPNTSTCYSSQFHSLSFNGFKHVFGTPAAHFSCTQVVFSGHWEVQSGYDTQFTMGGSDNSLWMAGFLNLGNRVAPTNGAYHIILNSMSKSSIGYIYITQNPGTRGMSLTGGGNAGCNFHGGTYEGTNAGNPSTFEAVNISAGTHSFFGTSFNHVTGVNGVIIQSGGQAAFYSPNYERANAVAASFPLLYQTGGTAQIYNATTPGSEHCFARWSDGSTTDLAPTNKVWN